MLKYVKLAVNGKIPLPSRLFLSAFKNLLSKGYYKEITAMVKNRTLENVGHDCYERLVHHLIAVSPTAKEVHNLTNHISQNGSDLNLSYYAINCLMTAHLSEKNEERANFWYKKRWGGSFSRHSSFCPSHFLKSTSCNIMVS
jgi:hypothetical protein